jgi:hypothetical protein
MSQEAKEEARKGKPRGAARMEEQKEHKETTQISFRDEQDTVDYIHASAEYEEIPVAAFIRKLCRYALRQYRKAGSLHALRVKEREEDGYIDSREQAARDAQVLEKLSPEAPPSARPRRAKAS